MFNLKFVWKCKKNITCFVFTYIRTLTIAMLRTTFCKWWHIRGVWIEDVLFVQSWAGCSRSLKTHLRLSPTHVPSSFELCRLMPPLQLLCSRSKRRQTGAISIHCRLPILLSSTVLLRHISFVKERPQVPCWRCWTDQILFCSVSPT